MNFIRYQFSIESQPVRPVNFGLKARVNASIRRGIPALGDAAIQDSEDRGKIRHLRGEGGVNYKRISQERNKMNDRFGKSLMHGREIPTFKSMNPDNENRLNSALQAARSNIRPW